MPWARGRLRPLRFGPIAPGAEKLRLVGDEKGAILGIAENGDARLSTARFVSQALSS